MYLLDAIPCPVCGGDTETERDSGEGRLHESHSRCRACPFWFQTFAYGYNEERIGFVDFDWSYDVSIEDDRRRVAERRVALDEIKRALAHPDFGSMCKAPIGILADWLEDHEFPNQAAAARQFNEGFFS